MVKISINTAKYLIIPVAIMGLVFSALPVSAISTADQQSLAQLQTGDLNSFVCSVLGSIGLGCVGGSKNQNEQPANQANQTNDNQTNSTISQSQDNQKLTAQAYAGKVQQKFTSNEISLVRVPWQTPQIPQSAEAPRDAERADIYLIIKGQKHLIPNLYIFYDYGFEDGMIQNITQGELDKYPRAKLVQPSGSKKIYYLTEGGLIRLVPDKKVYESYGDRAGDIIVISKKEFNFYPANNYVFLGQPLNRDVFLIQDGYKRYLTPMAVQRLGIMWEQLAPINQFEFDFYKTGAPIVY